MEECLSTSLLWDDVLLNGTSPDVDGLSVGFFHLSSSVGVTSIAVFASLLKSEVIKLGCAWSTAIADGRISGIDDGASDFSAGSIT